MLTKLFLEASTMVRFAPVATWALHEVDRRGGGGVGGQSALFNFESLLMVVLLLVCTCTYLHERWPSLLDNHKKGCAASLPAPFLVRALTPLPAPSTAWWVSSGRQRASVRACGGQVRSAGGG
jgi:hypothetical protein